MASYENHDFYCMNCGRKQTFYLQLFLIIIRRVIKMPKIINEIGNQYNNLKIIDNAPSKNGRKFYICECVICKNKYIISGTDLRTGKKFCKTCLHVGEQFGDLTILKLDHTAKDRHQYWECQCKCGNHEIIKYSDLSTGKKNKCFNCNKKPQYINELGNKYGKLKVIKYDSIHSNKNACWICQCDCGNIISVSGIKLRFGHTTSCGCLKSKGEFKISQLLQKNQINFKTQIHFDDCKNKNFLLFDFGIYNNENKLSYLIEYDGEQHFFYTNSGWNTQDHYEKIIERDKIKNKWCKENNIPLIRIPYTKYDTLSIKDLLLESSDFIWEEEVQ